MPDPRHYYEFHDAEYIKRIHAGQVGWEKGGYDEFFMRSFVARSLEWTNLRGPGCRALDLGCGTGALSCQLAEAGFAVTGVDVSPTAIGFAREMAKHRGLQITFEVGDVCQDQVFSEKFDLVVDGHLLHCIVFEEQRRTLLKRICRSLSSGGEFWVETMLLDDAHEPNPGWNLDERGVVWTRIPEKDQCHEAIQRNGEWYLPQRLIARSREFLLEELHLAELHILKEECYAPLEPGAPGGFRARCRRADL